MEWSSWGALENAGEGERAGESWGEALVDLGGEYSRWRVTRTSTKEKKIKQHRIIVY